MQLVQIWTGLEAYFSVISHVSSQIFNVPACSCGEVLKMAYCSVKCYQQARCLVLRNLCRSLLSAFLLASAVNNGLVPKHAALSATPQLTRLAHLTQRSHLTYFT